MFHDQPHSNPYVDWQAEHPAAAEAFSCYGKLSIALQGKMEQPTVRLLMLLLNYMTSAILPLTCPVHSSPLSSLQPHMCK